MMTAKTTSGGSELHNLRRVVRVRVPPEVPRRLFTEKMGTWWPLATYKIGKAEAVDALIEPCVGGRWYKLGDDGNTCDWGHVLSWEPHSRLVLSWEISADFQHDPNLKTEVEVRFIAEGKDRTRIELEHRHLDLYGTRRDEVRGIFDSDMGWKAPLDAFPARSAEG